MSTDFLKARKYITKAREALQLGDKQSARQWSKQAVLLAPEMEDAWLVLTASEANPQKAVGYARQAVELHPESPRARRAMEWALTRVKQDQERNGNAEQTAAPGLSRGRTGAAMRQPKRVSAKTAPIPGVKTATRNRLYLALLVGAGCLMVGFLAFFALTYPALASIVSSVSAPEPTQESLWASVDIPKPTIAPKLKDTALSTFSGTPTSAPTNAPALSATETPGILAMEIVDDNVTSQSLLGDEAQTQYRAEENGERWIDVNLSEQQVYAYEGDVVVNSFIVSTGVAETPTVTGKYRIYVKVPIQDMSGPRYYLPNVPWVMYFYEGYGFHGTYWHNNFGTPMSRGCVNMRIDDAAWLFNWASVGTVVNVHY